MLRKDLKKSEVTVGVYLDPESEEFIFESLDKEAMITRGEERYVINTISKEDAHNLAVSIMEALEYF